MQSFTEFLIRCEPAAWSAGIIGISIYVPLWMHFRGSLNRAVARNVLGLDPRTFSRRELQRKVEEHLGRDRPPFSLRNMCTAIWSRIQHPIASFRRAHDAWMDLRTQVAGVGTLSLRRLLIQEYSYSIASTGLEIGLAYLLIHMGLHFAAALAVTMPLGTIYALVRRTQLAVYARKRILALNGKTAEAVHPA